MESLLLASYGVDDEGLARVREPALRSRQGMSRAKAHRVGADVHRRAKLNADGIKDQGPRRRGVVFAIR
jgi:hypothetical protein